MSVPLISSIAAAVIASAAQSSPRVLAKPDVELADPFTNVTAVRELSDGRVIVVDGGDRSLYVADFAGNASRQIGRSGGGPTEYRVPGALLALPGDSTLVTDAGNRRLLLLGPDAEPVAVVTDAWPEASGKPGTRLPRAIDERGRGYFTGVSGGMTPNGELAQPDSVPILRGVRGVSSTDVVGYMQPMARRITTTTKNGQISAVDIRIPPFPAQDAWQVFPDGAVAFVRVKDYRVEWLLPDGSKVSGRPVPFTPIRVTDRDKAAVTGGGSVSRGRGSAGGPSPQALQLDWPDFKPPFAWSAVLAGADGRVWVLRYAPATDPWSHYEVFDRRGVLVSRADVPNGGRIVGFGRRSIYVVRKDEDDLQYLQRFPLGR